MVHAGLIDSDSTRVGAIAVRHEDRVTILAGGKPGARHPVTMRVDHHFTEKIARLALSHERHEAQPVHPATQPHFRPIAGKALPHGKRKSSSWPWVRLTKRPVPVWPSNTSNGPSRSERNATNVPSADMAASRSAPGKSVRRVNRALASGFSTGASPRYRTSQLAAAVTSASVTTAGHNNRERR